MRIFLLFMPIFLLAIPSLKQVMSYPHSYYRDFYLTEYLKKTKDAKQAEFLYKQIKYKKRYHFRLLANRNKKYKDLYNCKYPNRYNWNKIAIECIIQNGFNFNSLKKMRNKDIKKLLNILPDSTVKKEINIVLNKEYIKLFRNNLYFYDIFWGIKPNIYIPSLVINNILKDNHFHSFLNYVVRAPNLGNLKRSLLNIHYKEVKDKNKFLLTLNAIALHRYNLAIKILRSKKYKTNQDNFWLYLLTKKKKYANKLLKNKRLDFYTLYIYEEFHKAYKIDKINISNKAIPKYDINNPLDVIRFYKDKSKVKDYFSFAAKLDNNQTLPLKALILDKAYHYRKNYYIMPKYDLDDLNISSKALFYALARQESRFIPAQTSRSYAIGLMQMMPFLIRSFHPKEDISSFFRSDVNVKYAKKHMKWLMSKLNDNPLFVSYAYNGGIGFTKRKVLNYFKFKGEYEPFFSMEMVPYSESREYGKKVLTNYVIYKTLLGEKTTLHQLLKRD